MLILASARRHSLVLLCVCFEAKFPLNFLHHCLSSRFGKNLMEGANWDRGIQNFFQQYSCFSTRNFQCTILVVKDKHDTHLWWIHIILRSCWIQGWEDRHEHFNWQISLLTSQAIPMWPRGAAFLVDRTCCMVQLWWFDSLCTYFALHEDGDKTSNPN